MRTMRTRMGMHSHYHKTDIATYMEWAHRVQSTLALSQTGSSWLPSSLHATVMTCGATYHTYNSNKRDYKLSSLHATAMTHGATYHTYNSNKRTHVCT